MLQFLLNISQLLSQGVKSLLQASYDSCDQSCSSDRIQDENIKDSLTMVEDRVNELLTLLSYVHFQEKLSKWVCGQKTPSQWRWKPTTDTVH